MTQKEILTALKGQAEAGQLNGRAMLALYSNSTPAERKAKRDAAVDRYRQTGEPMTRTSAQNESNERSEAITAQDVAARLASLECERDRAIDDCVAAGDVALRLENQVTMARSALAVLDSEGGEG